MLAFFLHRLAAPLASIRNAAWLCLEELLPSGASGDVLAQIQALPWYAKSEMVRNAVGEALLKALGAETSLARLSRYCEALRRVVPLAKLADALARVIVSRPLLRRAVVDGADTQPHGVSSASLYALCCTIIGDALRDSGSEAMWRADDDSAGVLFQPMADDLKPKSVPHR